MKGNWYRGLLFVGLTMLVSFVKADDLENISLAIQTGNAAQVAKYFDNTVSITVFNSEGSYSKAQAEMVLKDFFSKNPPRSFKIIHKGNSSEGSQYAIGTLLSNKGSFRTYIYIKKKGSSYLIQEIRFEND